MIKQVQTYAGGALGFAVAVVWATLGLRTALACLFAAGVGAGVALYAQRRPRLGLTGRAEDIRTQARSLAEAAHKPKQPKPRTHAKPRASAKPRTSERRVGGYPVTKQVQETTYGW